VEALAVAAVSMLLRTQAASVAANAEGLLPSLAMERSATLVTGSARDLSPLLLVQHQTLWQEKAGSRASKVALVNTGNPPLGVRAVKTVALVALVVSSSHLSDPSVHNTRGSPLLLIRTVLGGPRCALMLLRQRRPQALQMPAHLPLLPLHLLHRPAAKRTVSEAQPAPEATPSSNKPNPFGAARPIDTAAREKEIEEKRQLELRQKKEADDKAREEKKAKDAEKAAVAKESASAEKKSDGEEKPKANFEILQRENEQGTARAKSWTTKL
jgi:type IV secretory pathway VirB10-like protein